MRNTLERARHHCVLPVLLLQLALGSVAAVAQEVPVRPVAAHPDSTQAVVATQLAMMMAAGLLMDGTMRSVLAAESAADHHRLSKVGNVLGRGEDFAMLLAVSYGGSRLLGLEEVSDPVGKTLAGLMAAGTANLLIKFTVGRARPAVDRELAGSFTPFSMDDRWQSFPSGHAVSAFALAAAISEQADRRWVTGVSFGAATLVGWSRIHEDRHWTSDVMAGAILGTVVSRMTVRHMKSRPTRDGGVQENVEGGDLFHGAMLYPIPSGLAVMIPTR